MKRVAMVVLFVVLVFGLAGCAAGTNPLVATTDAQGLVAGFWRGLWHGVIAPISFLVSLFSADVRVYEVHNSGAWYDFGFVLGLTSMHGGGHAARSRRSRRPAPNT
jgi:hypothetical protein